MALERDGAVKVSTLGAKTTRAAVVSELVKLGFEATKSVVRRPLGQQLASALEDGAFVPMKSVASYVVGGTAAEAKRAAAALVKTRRAKLVLRGAAEVLVAGTTPVLSREELAQFGRLAKAVAKAAASKRGASLLRSDVLESLREVVPEMRREQRPNGGDGRAEPADAGLERLLSAMDATRHVPAEFAHHSGENGAERLLGKGDLLANLGRGLVRAQAPLLG